jgi:hypothetical protein
MTNCLFHETCTHIYISPVLSIVKNRLIYVWISLFFFEGIPKQYPTRYNILILIGGWKLVKIEVKRLFIIGIITEEISMQSERWFDREKHPTSSDCNLPFIWKKCYFSLVLVEDFGVLGEYSNFKSKLKWHTKGSIKYFSFRSDEAFTTLIIVRRWSAIRKRWRVKSCFLLSSPNALK